MDTSVIGQAKSVIGQAKSVMVRLRVLWSG